jgi:small subunit ribosomal protein S16
MGAKHQPSYRIVVADSRSPRDGRYIDQVGFYDPLTNPATITIDEAKAVDWLRRGAQPTETVAILLGKKNIDPFEARGSKKPRPAQRATAPAKPAAAARAKPAASESEEANEPAEVSEQS